MAGALARGFAIGCGKPDRGADREPVGIFAGDVTAVDKIDGEDLVRPVPHTGLKPRPDDAWDIGGAGLPERLDRPLQDVGEFPVEPDAIEQVMPVDSAVPQPTGGD